MLDFEDRGIYWTSIDIANQFGLDKKSFTYRVQWVKDNLDKLESFVNDADSKAEYTTAVKALRIYQQGNLPAHMVYLDASNQALQLYAVLTGDKKTASTCNLANGKNMADAYQLLANAMNNEMSLTCFNRSLCKKALMTTMYGKQGAYTEILSAMYPRSNTPSIDFEREYKRDVMVDKDSTPIYPEFSSMEKAFKNAMIEIAPKAIVAMEAIQSLNNKDIGIYTWTMPDGFIVSYDVKTEVEYSFFDKSKNGINVKVEGIRELYQPSEKNAGMAPNVIHSVDGYIARQMIKRMSDEGKYITTIHDAFACLPEDCDFMRTTYSNILIELLDSNLLNDILSQIGNTATNVVKTANLTKEDILSSEYFLG